MKEGKEKIVLVGGGGHCKSVIEVIEAEGKFYIVGIVDKKKRKGTELSGYKIIGDDSDLIYIRREVDYALVTIGHIYDVKPRIYAFDKLKELRFKIPCIISPYSYVSARVEVGEGTVIMHKSYVGPDVEIGRNCIINTGAIVEHDCKIGDHCHISTGAILNGGVEVGDRVFIGSRAVIKEYVKIPSDTFVKAGSLIK